MIIWKYLLIIWSAAWQEQATAIALFIAGFPFKESFSLLLLGSTLGVIVFYFFPEELVFIIKSVGVLYYKARKLILGAQSQKVNLSSNFRWLQLTKQWIGMQQQFLIQRIVKNGYPQTVVFVIASLPFPLFLQIGIVSARLLKLKGRFWIVLGASFVRTYLLVVIVYKIGLIFSGP